MATRRSTLKIFGAVSALALAAALTVPALAANPTLKIGFVGVTSGPAAAWGTSNVRSMQTLADMMNADGGVKIGDKTYDIDIITFDDQKDPKLSIQGMEKMAQEGVHYVVGPNVDDGAASVRPVAEKNGIIYFPYAFPKSLYVKPASNAVLGMVANYQSGPAIYKYLMEHNGIKTVAFVAAKLEAFADRGAGDMLASHDLEDVLNIVDGREELAGELARAPSLLKQAAGAAFATLLAHPDFTNVLPGLIAEPERAGIVQERLRGMAAWAVSGNGGTTSPR